MSFVVRPERIELGFGQRNRSSCEAAVVAGTIVSVVDRGAYVRVEVDARQLLVVHLSSADPACSHLAPGALVHATIRPEAVYVLNGAGDASAVRDGNAHDAGKQNHL